MAALTLEQMNRDGLSRVMDVRSVDVDGRTVELAFSSEAEVERYFGIEILDHSPSSVEMERLNDKAPLLMDHNMTDQIGVVVSATIDMDRVGRATVRLGKSERASDILRDIQDGIRAHVSVGYRVHEMTLTESRDGESVYTVTRWEPYEISIVSVPADTSVGIGRTAGAGMATHTRSRMEKQKTVDIALLIDEAFKHQPFRHEVDGNGDVTRTIPLPAGITRTISLANDILPNSAGTSEVVSLAIANQSLVAKAGVTIIPVSVTPNTPMGLTENVKVMGSNLLFVITEAGEFNEILIDGADAPVSELPYTISRFDDANTACYALRFDLSRKQLRHEMQSGDVATSISRGIEKGLANLVDHLTLKAIESVAAPVLVADASFIGLARLVTARGLRFDEMRAFAGGGLTGIEQVAEGTIISCGIPADLTNQTTATLFAACNRIGCFIFDDIRVNCKQNTKSSSMEFTVFVNAEVAIPDPSVCWKLSGVA